MTNSCKKSEKKLKAIEPKVVGGGRKQVQQRHTISSAEQNIFCRESRNICDNEFQTLLSDPQIAVLGHYAPGGYNATAIVSVGG